jgi:hypothetical protein
MAKITVTAGEGRRVPIPKSIATGPGDTLLYLEHCESTLKVEGHETTRSLEVDEAHHFVVRGLRNGDLVRAASSSSASAASPIPAIATKG